MFFVSNNLLARIKYLNMNIYKRNSVLLATFYSCLSRKDELIGSPEPSGSQGELII